MYTMNGILVEVLERWLSPSSIVKTDEKYLLKVLAIFSGASGLHHGQQPQKLQISYALFEKLTNVPHFMLL